jgi:hypothetical protein
MADLNEKKTCETTTPYVERECPGNYYQERDRLRKEEHWKIFSARYSKRRCKAKTKAGKPCKCIEGTYDQVFTSDGYCTFHKRFSVDKEPDDVPIERLLGECKDEDFPQDENTKPKP